MSSSVTQFSDAIISASSWCGTDRDILWNGFFDFALFGASWDKRCTAVTQCTDLSFQTSVAILPYTDVPDSKLELHQNSLFEFCRLHSVNFHSLASKTTDLPKTLASLRAHFWSTIHSENRTCPARVFIDVTTCPRYFSLALLGDAFRSGLVVEIVLSYSEGAYPDAAPSYDEMEEISFTDGSFNATPVPGFLGEFEPKKSGFYLVSTGFDGWKTLNLLTRREPERVAALLASPGIRPEYERRALSANEHLFRRFGVDESLIVKAAAGDAVAAWRRVTEASIENFERENVFYLCSGNKAHSVGLALRALAKGVPALLYNRPNKHLPSSVEFSGNFWAYSVKPVAGTVFG